jgi:hypothetical protein
LQVLDITLREDPQPFNGSSTDSLSIGEHLYEYASRAKYFTHHNRPAKMALRYHGTSRHMLRIATNRFPVCDALFDCAGDVRDDHGTTAVVACFWC